MTLPDDFIGDTAAAGDAPHAAIHRDVEGALHPRYTLRPYQREALIRFATRIDANEGDEVPTRHLFHMATGSGKTLVMAALIIDLYRRGYRRFVFLVNSTNVIDKTRDNFLNPGSSKYLFQQPIFIDRRRVKIREVRNFQSLDSGAVNIVFTTVQGLHSQLSQPRENSLTAADIGGQPVALISDEAHHINATTKRRGQTSRREREDLASWEQTVDRIFQSHPGNLLLEFTATAPLDHPEVARKYRDKIAMDYPLKRFRQEGYSKEVMVLQSDLPPFLRALQAMILSRFRQLRFESADIKSKPVVLFKSRTIADNRAFYAEFVERLPHCEPDLQTLRRAAKSGRMAEAFAEFDRRGLSNGDLAAELALDFAPNRLLVIDSRSDVEKETNILNTLEDADNPYRGIFAVDKLNEGWDVLNLFDIVRLYDVAGSTGRMRKSTMAEAQLIGRGARYFPFVAGTDQIRDRRKFDHDTRHPMRVCEELIYHAAHNPSYIAELGRALTGIGIRPDKDEKTSRKRRSLQTTKPTYLPVPDRLTVTWYAHRNEMTPLSESSQTDWSGHDRMGTLQALDLGLSVWKKAIRLRRNYWFDRLQERYPEVKGVEEFIRGGAYLGRLEISVVGDVPPEALTQSDKLKLALAVLDGLDEGNRKEMVAEC